MEMQHNSRLKQLLREYNTQMAKKEQELESAVREAIGEGMVRDAKSSYKFTSLAASTISFASLAYLNIRINLILFFFVLGVILVLLAGHISKLHRDA